MMPASPPALRGQTMHIGRTIALKRPKMPRFALDLEQAFWYTVVTRNKNKCSMLTNTINVLG